MPRILPSVFAGCVLAAIGLSQARASVVDTIPLQTPAPLSFTDNVGALYSLTATQPVGSGVFNPFMRIQRTGESQGYNSSLNNGSNATMDLINLPGNSSSQLPLNSMLTDNFQVMLTLDYNEQGASGKSLLNLTDLVLVVSTDPNKTGPAGPGNHGAWTPQSIPLSPGDQIVYDMANSTDGSGNPFQIQMNANKNPANGNGGSGTADLTFTYSLFGRSDLTTLLDGSHYLYVYSRFSNAGAGFEEWNSFFRDVPLPAGGGPNVPEAATLSLLGLGGAGLLLRRRSRS